MEGWLPQASRTVKLTFPNDWYGDDGAWTAMSVLTGWTFETLPAGLSSATSLRT